MRTLLTRRESLYLPLILPALRAATVPHWRAEEVRRFPAPEARQAVAVDAECFYAIGNHVVAKYNKETGKRISDWECEEGKPLVHLNSGVIRQGLLYCAHSSYPDVPMASSIEIWDTKTLRHTGTHSFGISDGSVTWLDFHGGHWYVCFAHYNNRAAEPNRDNRWTTLVQFDSEWRRLQGWIFPKEVISRLGTYSISGGVFAPGGAIFCTGHDNQEMYVLRFPEGGSTLVLEETFATANKGQGIGWDPAQTGMLYGIDKAKQEIIVMRVRES